MSVREFLFQDNNTRVFVVLKNVTQTVPCIHGLCIRFNNGVQKVTRYGGIIPLKHGSGKCIVQFLRQWKWRPSPKIFPEE